MFFPPLIYIIIYKKCTCILSLMINIKHLQKDINEFCFLQMFFSLTYIHVCLVLWWKHLQKDINVNEFCLLSERKIVKAWLSVNIDWLIHVHVSAVEPLDILHTKMSYDINLIIL